MSVLEVRDVSIRYITGDFKDIGIKEYLMKRLKGNYQVSEFWADRDISFSLEKGEMLGIIGSNGAGKSTLLKVVSGIMEPTKGWVKRDGRVAALLELASGFDGDLTVKENAYLRGAMLGYTRKFMDETYEEIVEFAELKEFEDRPFRQLSSGMKSRLAFSIASLVQPDILILDEVLSVGDGAFRKKSENKMREIIGRGATTILVSHALGQVRELCTKVLWLEKGEQIAFGDTKLICSLYQQYLDKEIDLKQAREMWAWLNGSFDYLVVGSGLFGSVFANEATARGKSCLVIESRKNLGGYLYCEDMDGIPVHWFGPHIFHTNREELWDYVNEYIKLEPYDGGFGERFQGMPAAGYNDLIAQLLHNIPVICGVNYKMLMEAGLKPGTMVIYTGAIDRFFEFGSLKYHTIRYELAVSEELELTREQQKMDMKTIEEPKGLYFQDQAIVTCEDDSENCSRIIEYKHFAHAACKGTVIAREFVGDLLPGWLPYKPIDDEENQKLLQRYHKLAEEYPDIIFCGRLGEFQSYSMAETIDAARSLAERTVSQLEPVRPGSETCRDAVD